MELDGTYLVVLIAGKRVKIFKEREMASVYIELLNINKDEEWQETLPTLAHTGWCAGLVGVDVVLNMVH